MRQQRNAAAVEGKYYLYYPSIAFEDYTHSDTYNETCLLMKLCDVRTLSAL